MIFPSQYNVALNLFPPLSEPQKEVIPRRSITRDRHLHPSVAVVLRSGRRRQRYHGYQKEKINAVVYFVTPEYRRTAATSPRTAAAIAGVETYVKLPGDVLSRPIAVRSNGL
jgi:hypothetical protein